MGASSASWLQLIHSCLIAEVYTVDGVKLYKGQTFGCYNMLRC